MFTYLTAIDANRPAFAVVSTNAVLFIEADLTGQALHELWQSMRQLSAEQLLDELHSVASSGLEDFAMISFSKDRLVTLAVGGHGRAVINDSPAFMSPGRVATTEARQEDCARVLLTIGGFDTLAGGGVELPIADGIVRCAGIVYQPSPSEPLDAGAPKTSAEPESAGAPVSSRTAPRHAHAEPDVPAPPAPQPNPEAASEAQPTNKFDHLFEHTQFFDVAEAAVQSQAVAPAGTDAPAEAAASQQGAAQSEAGTHQKMAATEQDAVPSPASTPRVEPQAPTRQSPPAGEQVVGAGRSSSRLSLVLPDGSRHVLDRPIIIGRRPVLSADADVRDYHLVKLEDRAGGLSRMHVRLDPHKGGAMITDLGSTNGTLVATPGGPAVELRPHTPHLAKDGDQLRLSNAIICFLTAEV